MGDIQSYILAVFSVMLLQPALQTSTPGRMGHLHRNYLSDTCTGITRSVLQ